MARHVRRQIILEVHDDVGEVQLLIVLQRLPAVRHQPVAAADRLLAQAQPVAGVEGVRAALERDVGVVRGRQVAAEHDRAAALERVPGELHHLEVRAVHRTERAGAEQHDQRP